MARRLALNGGHDGLVLLAGAERTAASCSAAQRGSFRILSDLQLHRGGTANDETRQLISWLYEKVGLLQRAFHSSDSRCSVSHSPTCSLFSWYIMPDTCLTCVAPGE